MSQEQEELEEKIINVNRVAKVVKGGRRFSFSALVVVGNKQGKVGVGFGKANEVSLAIQKAVTAAKNNFFTVPLDGSTIPFSIISEYGAGKVMLKPARPGVGIIAGGPVRAVMEAAGIKDVLTKSLGSSNPINVVKATVKGLKEIKRIYEIAQMRAGLEVS